MKKISAVLVVLAIAVLLSGLLKGRVFLNIFTTSLPQGIYLKKEGEFRRGEYALTCLNDKIARYGLERGYLRKGDCKTGIIPVGKIIKGIPGDTFFVDNNSLHINGESFAIKSHDAAGRVQTVFYAAGRNVLKDGEYLLLSNHVEDSWDSRYWGPVSVEFLLKSWILYGRK